WRARAGVARSVCADPHAAPGGRLLPRPRVSHRRGAPGDRWPATLVALLRCRARRPARACLRTHRRCRRAVLDRCLEVGLGRAARPFCRPVAGLHPRKELVMMRRLLFVFVGSVLLLAVLAVGLLWTVASLLRAGPGEWSRPVHVGPWHVEASVPTLVRMA